MENQNPRVPPLWEHSLTTILGHDPTSDAGIALRQRYTPLMTMVRAYTLGPTKSNKYVG